MKVGILTRMSQFLDILNAETSLRNALQYSDDMNIDNALTILGDARKSLEKLTERYTHLKKMRDQPTYRVMTEYRQAHPEEKGYVLVSYKKDEHLSYQVVDRDPKNVSALWDRNIGTELPAGYQCFAFWAGDPHLAPSSRA